MVVLNENIDKTNDCNVKLMLPAIKLIRMELLNQRVSSWFFCNEIGQIRNLIIDF